MERLRGKNGLFMPSTRKYEPLLEYNSVQLYANSYAKTRRAEHLWALNEFLLQKPYHIGVKNISQYSEKVYSTTLVGRGDELEILANHLENTLKSVGKKEEDFDLKSFLMSLEKVNRLGVNQKEPPQGLGEMIFVRASLLERFKGKIKSPYTTSVVAIVTMIITLVAVVIQALK